MNDYTNDINNLDDSGQLTLFTATEGSVEDLISCQTASLYTIQLVKLWQGSDLEWTLQNRNLTQEKKIDIELKYHSDHLGMMDGW